MAAFAFPLIEVSCWRSVGVMTTSWATIRWCSALGRGEVLVARVHGLELAAVHRRHGLGEEADLAAQHDEVGAGRLDRRTIVLPEVGDGLVVRRELPRQPHQ